MLWLKHNLGMVINLLVMDIIKFTTQNMLQNICHYRSTVGVRWVPLLEEVLTPAMLNSS